MQKLAGARGLSCTSLVNAMHKFVEKKLLRHSARELLDLVLDIEKYPEFLPWVSDTKIISRGDGELVADMTADFKAIRQSYRSKVKYGFDGETAFVEVDATNGPFKHLHNLWHFTVAEEGTIVEFRVDFEFKSKLLGSVASPLFSAIAQKMILAFEKRAKELYQIPN